MNQIIHLSKAKLLNTLPINDFCGNNKQKRNIAVLFVVVIVYMAINMGAFSVTTTMNLIHAGLVEYVYASLLSLTSVALITLLLFTLNALLFEGNDYDMLQSLPVSKRDIIASKLLIVYIFAFCFTCGMMLPGMVVHVLITHAYLQLAFGTLSLVFVPVIPIGIAIIFSVGILYVASFAKHTTVLKVLLSVLLFIGLMVGSFLLQSAGGLSTMIGLQMIQIYPLSLIFLKSNLLYACISIVVSVSIFYMLTWKYEVLHKLSTKRRVIYHDATFKHHSAFHALYQKEVQRFFGSYLAVINQGVWCHYVSNRECTVGVCATNSTVFHVESVGNSCKCGGLYSACDCRDAGIHIPFSFFLIIRRKEFMDYSNCSNQDERYYI